MLNVYLFASTLLTLFVILDPPGLMPVFLGLTRDLGTKERRAVALRASTVALGIIASFAVFGQQILSYLHITVESMQVSGGLLLGLVALQMLLGSSDGALNVDAANRHRVSIVPLGIPLIAGPGSIVAMMVAVDRSRGLPDLLAVGSPCWWRWRWCGSPCVTPEP